MNIKNLFILIPLLILFSGCGLLVKLDDPKVSHAAGSAETGLHNRSLLKKKLYSQYEEWKGVRYRLGGLNKKGIDCSGFVYMTFKSKFGVKLPRTTELQSKLGDPVKRSKLKTGDLIFFKTSPRVRHVGIYLEKGKFLHASKKRGVMISRLSNVYWKSRYWKAKRVERL
ncbi:MAG: glycoside hydrolase [Deltaproteobacteria bacterium]|jgi:cell wall-associated NlpC family hydrolase|nr:glycoside hydrolase [Deltaproteobacteria bacterium]